MPSCEAKTLRHLGIIMDGNGRWATARGLPRMEGHRRGLQRAKALVPAVFKRGIDYLTLWAFSTENWGRPLAEVNGLMQLCVYFAEQYTKTLVKDGIRLHVLGDLEKVPEAPRQALKNSMQATCEGNKHLCVAFNYGARDEIVRAVRKCIDAGQKPDDWASLAAYLDTAGIPDPDLIVRTGGEMRLSGFLALQAIYSELYFTPVYWPDFTQKELDNAIVTFNFRNRRFGKCV